MRHARTDPACSRHRRPSGRLSTWWFDRHRGRITHEDTYADENLLRLLARPYADHPDYREEWKP